MRCDFSLVEQRHRCRADLGGSTPEPHSTVVVIHQFGDIGQPVESVGNLGSTLHLASHLDCPLSPGAR